MAVGQKNWHATATLIYGSSNGGPELYMSQFARHPGEAIIHSNAEHAAHKAHTIYIGLHHATSAIERKIYHIK